jgi:2-polyprenyl-3-methyl-5-hydroxy-6-metoxy-1,4-benzoquinol methylase
MSIFDKILGRTTNFGKANLPLCRLCGAPGVSAVGAVAPTHSGNFHTKDFTLQHCVHCDVVYLEPLPTPGDLKLLYEESVQFSDAHYSAPEQVEKILEFYGTVLQSLKLAPPSGAKVLEIGAGLAWVSRACKARDPGIKTVAQDVSAECKDACPWVDRYFVGPLDMLPERGPYALISLTHVLEHLADPLAMLRQVAHLLVPGGKVFITAPFRPTRWQPGDGIAAWLSYSYLHVPAHITYFSKRWFEKQTCGLKIEHWDSTHEDGQAFAVVLRKA